VQPLPPHLKKGSKTSVRATLEEQQLVSPPLTYLLFASLSSYLYFVYLLILTFDDDE
jgi:hypothetical protein